MREKLRVCLLNQISDQPAPYQARIRELTVFWLEPMLREAARFFDLEFSELNGDSVDSLAPSADYLFTLSYGQFCFDPNLLPRAIEMLRSNPNIGFRGGLTLQRPGAMSFLPWPSEWKDLILDLSAENSAPIQKFFQDPSQLSQLKGEQKGYFSGVQSSRAASSIFTLNTDDLGAMDFPLARLGKKIDALYSVAAAFKPMLILQRNGFHSATEITYFDYSQPALHFKQWLLENWDGLNYSSAIAEFKTTQPESTRFVSFLHLDFQEDLQRQMAHFGDAKAFESFWQKYRKLKHHFLPLNLFESPELLTEKIKADRESLPEQYIWWSNSFYTEAALASLGQQNLKKKYLLFQQALSEANPEIWVDGGSHQEGCFPVDRWKNSAHFKELEGRSLSRFITIPRE